MAAPVAPMKAALSAKVSDLHPRGVDAERLRALLVGADGDQGIAPRAIAGARGHRQHEDDQAEHRVVERPRPGRGQEQPADGAGDARLVPDQDVLGQLGEPEGEDREVRAAQPERQRPDDERHGRAHRRAGHHGQRPRRRRPTVERGGVGAGAEERARGQREIARVGPRRTPRRRPGTTSARTASGQRPGVGRRGTRARRPAPRRPRPRRGARAPGRPSAAAKHPRRAARTRISDSTA